MTISNDITPLPKADDQYQITTITVAIHSKAAYYNPADVKKVVLADLMNLVPKGEALSQSPDINDPKVIQASDDGTVTFLATGAGFRQPVINVEELKRKFSGQSADSVKNVASEEVNQLQDVTVSRSLFHLWFLPLLSGHITVQQKFVPNRKALL